MTAVDAILIVAAISTGLFTGLLMTILAFFQRVLRSLTAPQFTVVMHRFLGVVRTHPLNYGLVITSILAPAAVLVLLRGSAGGPAFVLVLARLVAFVAGPVLVLRFFADLRRLPELEARGAARGLASGARPLLPPQRVPGARVGGGLRFFLAGLAVS